MDTTRPGRLIGYARVSTGEQDLALQLDALRQGACTDKYIFTDKISGSKKERPGLDRCLEETEVWRHIGGMEAGSTRTQPSSSNPVSE